jgi:hypothetical protein
LLNLVAILLLFTHFSKAVFQNAKMMLHAAWGESEKRHPDMAIGLLILSQ